MPRIVSILCASRNSAYHDLEDVEVYDPDRDARTFSGGTPIVAHPPCRAWSVKTSQLAKPAPGEKELALWCVERLRDCGGILEHPAYSTLFAAANLPRPTEGHRHGLWSIEVWQAWWGFPMKKATWLVFAGIHPRDVHFPYALHPKGGDLRTGQLLSTKQRSATTPAFARWLVHTARLSTTAHRPPDATPKAT